MNRSRKGTTEEADDLLLQVSQTVTLPRKTRADAEGAATEALQVRGSAGVGGTRAENKVGGGGGGRSGGR